MRKWVLAITLIVMVALDAHAVPARDCHRETPLPPDVRVSAPEPAVPEITARFSGTWNGVWKDSARDGACGTLVVEDVRPNGFARVVYSHGTDEGWRIHQPNFFRATGRVVDGVLRVRLPIPEPPEVVYQFADGTLSGTINKVSGTFTRVTDVARVACRPSFDRRGSSPPSPGPRDRLTAAELLGAGSPTVRPVHNDYFMPLGDQRGNGTRNGLATFLYDDTRVSALRFQLVQETWPWASFDLWGQAPMTYAPGAVPNEAAVRAEFVAELQHEVPIRPWSALPAPAAALPGFDGDVAPEDISATGLVVDGTIYLRGCQTRYGPYPYCRHMRHGAFSVTKSMGAAVALFRLAAKYGDAVFDLRIKDHVPVTASHDGWERVTFRDALDMATGIGDRSPQREPLDSQPDELRAKMFRWATAPTAKEKLDIAFTYGTYVLAAAMDAFLKRREGPNAHLWDMVVNEVYRPIGILHAPVQHTIEKDGSRGIPLLAYGLFPTIDDVAKVTTLLQNGGRHGDRQILHAKSVAEGLYRSAAPGLPTGGRNRFGDARYLRSFWSTPYRTASGCFFRVPYMSGLGGNLVVLMPNGVSGFRFADAMNYDPESMIRAGEAVRPFCTAPPADASPAPASRSPLTADELRAELPGHTFQVGPFTMLIAPDGRLYATRGNEFDTGTWEITRDGRYCRAWNVANDRRTRCYTVHRDGDRFELHVEDRWGVAVLRRTPGHPQGW